MVNTYFRYLLLVVLTLTAFSCAKEVGEDTSDITYEAFKAWMAREHPDVEELESGLYVEWVEKNAAGDQLIDGYWMKLNYTAMSQKGDILYSRSPEVMKQVGFYSEQTRYVPDYLQYNTSELLYSSTIPIGSLYMLKELTEGDSLRIYMPPGYAYSSYSKYVTSNTSNSELTYNAFYTTNAVSYTQAAIMDLRLEQVVKDPTEYEKEEAAVYLRDSLNLTLADSITIGVYMEKLHENPLGDSLTRDSTAKVWFAGYHLDGFLFDTNIDSIAKLHNYTGGGSALESVPLSTSSSYIEGYVEAILEMRKGEKARVVILSTKGYGAEGSSPKIQPYETLIFDIEVYDNTAYKSDDDE